ncbi:hypothetical protein CPB83DRAFT_845168 [Crepidotus variabilis]|uniref:MIT domain-containing protein n=1 Tax=Crepidotus variabilis TaxID=179855 RepID=A0A9P6EQI3_9AGAR|nr:hypothetical protein CPB83DRAFT_845168 [Crepidotus variabilis]
MSALETPMNAAHQHAANADDYITQGLIVLAAEEHLKAAEAYTAAIDRSHDESAKRTLRMLYNEHCKAAKDLHRKIDKLKDEGADPALPHRPELPKASPQPILTNGNTRGGHKTMSGAPSPPPTHRPMAESTVGDESFMLLGGQRSDPGDAFNQFWNIMQGMLDNLSQPVAFATVPLGPDTPPQETPMAEKMASGHRRDGNLSSDTDPEEPIFSKFTRKIGLSNPGSKISERTSRNQKPTHSTKSKDDFSFEEDDDFFEEGDDLSGSFFLIPTGSEPSPAVLKKENATLKAEVASLKSRLDGTEKVLKLRKEQDVHLRDSIFQATREAQRALGASTMLQRPGPPLDLSSLNMNLPAVPIPGISPNREAQYNKRIKELEEELRLMKVENDKNKLMIAKFRERWEKLKDSAKRKKEAKAAAEVASTGVRDRIVEEPEAEEELDDRNARAM